MEVDGPALALGSTQSIDDVDLSVAAELGVDVFNRRSGGGAVLLDPGAQIWIDVVIARGDPLWNDDVGVAVHWLGEIWADALVSIGVEGATVHTGAMSSNDLSPVVCFAGLGPGEVTVDGAKVVGISQRRSRAGARFQCSVPLVWDAARHARLLAPGVRRVAGSLDSVRIAPATDGDSLREAFLDRLP